MLKLLLEVIVICMILNQITCDECDRPNINNNLPTSSCCKMPLLLDTPWTEECTTELALPMPPGLKHMEYECKLYECVFKKGGGVVDDKPNAAAIKKQMKSILDKSPGWETVFNTAVDKCVPEAISKEDETRKRSSEPPFNIDKSVNTVYGYIVSCIAGHLFINCPSPTEANNPNCEVMKSYLKKCLNEFPPRFMEPIAV